jgi:hypothetical protein
VHNVILGYEANEVLDRHEMRLLLVDQNVPGHLSTVLDSVG